MPPPNTPIAQVLQFANTHSLALVTDGQLQIRLGPNGLEILADGEPAGEYELERVMTIRLVAPDNLDLLRIAPALPPPRYDHGWRLDVTSLVYNLVVK